MRTVIAIRALALAALLPALAAPPLGAVPGPGSEVSERGLRRFTAGARRAALVVVELEYSPVSGQQGGLEIRRARAVPGLPPFLRDAQGLGGRIELLDRRGRVVWAMGYRPAPLPRQKAQGVATTLRLRAPRHPKAVRVRVKEAQGGLSAEAPIEP